MAFPENDPVSISQESVQDRFAHFSIPGFETLNERQQSLFLKIPTEHLTTARPLIEREIANAKERQDRRNTATATLGEGQTEHAYAAKRENQALEAIDTFHRAEQGDPKAQKDLRDQKKEMFGEEDGDEDIFKTILETEASDPFKQDMAMEMILSDEQAQTTQRVFDMFKNYRADLASVDDALAPPQQLELFLLLSKGQGGLERRFEFVRKVLKHITKDGTINLFEALNSRDLLKDHRLVEPKLAEAVKGWEQDEQFLFNSL